MKIQEQIVRLNNYGIPTYEDEGMRLTDRYKLYNIIYRIKESIRRW